MLDHFRHIQREYLEGMMHTASRETPNYLGVSRVFSPSADAFSGA